MPHAGEPIGCGPSVGKEGNEHEGLKPSARSPLVHREAPVRPGVSCAAHRSAAAASTGAPSSRQHPKRPLNRRLAYGPPEGVKVLGFPESVLTPPFAALI